MPSRAGTTLLLSKRKRERFLHAIATAMTVTEACAEVGLSRQCVYACKGVDPTFNAEWERSQRIEERDLREGTPA
jgi:hypothetical protein